MARSFVLCFMGWVTQALPMNPSRPSSLLLSSETPYGNSLLLLQTQSPAISEIIDMGMALGGFLEDGSVMPSWFDIHEIPVTAVRFSKDENGVLKAVQNVHAMIDKELAAGTNPKKHICALTLASVLLYPRTLGGGAVFSGWVPFNSTMIERMPADAKKTPILWSHGMADRTVLFEAGQAGPLSLNKLAYPGLAHSISNEEIAGT
ncbi:putative carboxylesterase SOBER1-like [Vitis vinifera]|uniref:Putative carboxylesterase SOBER1-like n=1 Tax=Vitis vinifera TaxID=29760 RepID=A0A438EE90_VITVI|nr:putative carboxylesterase SOBER1-like [Vitis vinifera]